MRVAGAMPMVVWLKMRLWAKAGVDGESMCAFVVFAEERSGGASQEQPQIAQEYIADAA